MVMRSMRKNIGILKWMFVLLLVVFGVGLILPGAMGRRELAGAAALVNGEPVSSQEYSRRLQERLESARQARGGELSEAESARLRRECLEELIGETLALSQARSLGLTLSREEFRQIVMSDPRLRDDKGRFDEALYQRLLQSRAEQGRSWQEAEAGVQKSLLLAKVFDFWTDQALLDAKESRAAEALYNRQVRVQAVTWDLDALRAQAPPSQEDARSYYSQHKRDWTLPPQYKLRQILIRPSFAGTSGAAKARAEGLLAKLKAGADFAALAAAENADEGARKASGALGWMAPSDLRYAQLAQAAAKLKEGGVSEVIASPEGFHLLRLEGRRAGFQPSFENSGARAARELGLQRASRRAVALAHQALELLKKGRSAAEAAKASGGRVVESGWFGRDETAVLPGLGSQPPFVHAALALAKGEVLDRPVFFKNAVAVARLSEERPGAAPADPAKAAARSREAREDARDRKARALYEAWLEGLRKKADIRDQSGVLASR